MPSTKRQPYILVFERSASNKSNTLSTDEQERLRDLYQQDILQQVFVNRVYTKVWLIIKAPSSTEVDDVVASLPSPLNYLEHHSLIRH